MLQKKGIEIELITTIYDIVYNGVDANTLAKFLVTKSNHSLITFLLYNKQALNLLLKVQIYLMQQLYHYLLYLL